MACSLSVAVVGMRPVAVLAAEVRFPHGDSKTVLHMEMRLQRLASFRFFGVAAGGPVVGIGYWA
jgi:hypothetical protein